MAVAMSSLPDSRSFELTSLGGVRDSLYQFRILRSAKHIGASKSLHGYVFCRQRQDVGLPRGGEQRAVVVLSPLPISEMLQPLAKYAGMLVSSRGNGVLKEIFEEVRSWPPPSWGSKMEIFLHRSSLRASIPCLSTLSSDAVEGVVELFATKENKLCRARVLSAGLDPISGLPLWYNDSTYGGKMASSCPERSPYMGQTTDLFLPLAASLDNLNALWEAVMVGEPLMIVGPSPDMCSAAVLAMISIIMPMPYCLDFRPYFSLHDASFSDLVGTNGNFDAAVPRIIGITNPQILAALPSWPNILMTGFSATTRCDTTAVDYTTIMGNGSSSMTRTGSSNSMRDGTTFRHGLWHMLKESIFSARWRNRPSEYALKALRNRRRSDGAWLSYTPVIRPCNSNLLEKLTRINPSDNAHRRAIVARKNSNLLRQYFGTLTRAALDPLAEYIRPQTLLQSMNEGSALCPDDDIDSKHPPSISKPPTLSANAFAADVVSGKITVPDFLAEQFSSIDSVAEFYRRLMSGSQLKEWLKLRHEAIHAWTQKDPLDDDRCR